MYLKHISILNYKNIREFETEFSSRFNCFLGKNGAGKTNLMDAIYYLSFTKSHFNAIDRQNIRHGEEMFVIEGKYNIKDEQITMLCGLKKHGKKQVKRDGKAYVKFAEHIGMLPLVFITPSDTEMIHLGSDLRRKYIDGVISQYDKHFLKQLIDYNRALEQRNALLKKISTKNPYDKDALLIWDERMHAAGKYIHKKRKEAVNALIPIFNRYYDDISGKKEQVNITYKSSLHHKTLIKLLEENREKELLFHHTTTGIHRDDLHFELNGHSLKKTGSQGQQKTFIIALKLAQFDFIHQTMDIPPVLLLDDIFDKLDDFRINQLVQLLSDDRYGQVFFSDTSEERLPELLKPIDVDVRIFNININSYENYEENPDSCIDNDDTGNHQPGTEQSQTQK
ncbi:MAG: DNA replication/repair protein RecF [Candidatus Delongbacteria bacterium]|nr:DNA replication/repair protein RecF [Candidatus Delongbacteria bacterium]